MQPILLVCWQSCRVFPYSSFLRYAFVPLPTPQVFYEKQGFVRRWSYWKTKITRITKESINTYSWKNWAIAILDWSSRFMFSSAFNESWKVLGSMFGNIRSAKGKANSMKGIIRNMEKGTILNRSETVRSNCFRSRRVKVEPESVRPNRLRAVRTSAINS